ncbi:MAG: hypothetical protein KTR29_23890 [Rhodothermaceae bacterium]|nr:hypothetical protein [Rhodothermaceae bacterium]
MVEKRIKIELSDPKWLKSQLRIDNSGEPRIEIEDASIILPPHVGNSRNFAAEAIITGFVTFAGNVAAGLVAAYLYDAMKSGKISRIFVGGEEVSTEEEIELSLQDTD